LGYLSLRHQDTLAVFLTAFLETHAAPKPKDRQVESIESTVFFPRAKLFLKARWNGSSSLPIRSVKLTVGIEVFRRNFPWLGGAEDNEGVTVL
jgi:hypothetical protein